MTSILDLVQVAIVLVLSTISGIGSYLMSVRDGRIDKSFLNLTAEIFVALTAGAMAFLVGNHRHWDVSVVYLSVILASNNGNEVMKTIKRVNIEMLTTGISNLFKKGGGS